MHGTRKVTKIKNFCTFKLVLYVVFCSSLMSYFSGMLLRYFGNGFEMVQVTLSLLVSLFLHFLYALFLLQRLCILKYFRIIIITIIIIIIVILYLKCSVLSL